MYAIYDRQKEGGTLVFRFLKQAHLFGWSEARRDGGWIPYLLQEHLSAGPRNQISSEWHIGADEIRRSLLADNDKPCGNTLIIEIKPNHKNVLMLCEVIDIWGYSSRGWTPMMLHLRRLVDMNRQEADAGEFSIPEDDGNMLQPIFTITYTPDGTITGEGVMGKWPPPAPSATNSALLWPEVFRYFADEAMKLPR